MKECAQNSHNFLPAVSHTEVYWDFGDKAEGIIVDTKREAYVCAHCGEERPALIWSEPKKTLDGTIITKCNTDTLRQVRVIVKIKGDSVKVIGHILTNGVSIIPLMLFERGGMSIADIQIKASSFHYNHYKQGGYELPA